MASTDFLINPLNKLSKSVCFNIDVAKGYTSIIILLFCILFAIASSDILSYKFFMNGDNLSIAENSSCFAICNLVPFNKKSRKSITKKQPLWVNVENDRFFPIQ